MDKLKYVLYDTERMLEKEEVSFSSLDYFRKTRGGLVDYLEDKEEGKKIDRKRIKKLKFFLYNCKKRLLREVSGSLNNHLKIVFARSLNQLGGKEITKEERKDLSFVI